MDRTQDMGLVQPEAVPLPRVGVAGPASGVTINSQLFGPGPVRWTLARSSHVSMEFDFLGPVT